MTESRETSRDALTTLLTTALTGAGNPCQAVIGHKPTKNDIKNRSPLVAVMSRGSDRVRFTFEGGRLEALLTIQIWVLGSDASGSWTAALAEDKLDEIEADIFNTLEQNCSTDNWAWISYDGESVADDIPYDGTPYIVENIPIRVKVHK